MRDDITYLVDNKIDLYKSKLDLVNKLLLNESEKIFFLKKDDINRTVRISEDDNEIIDEINVIDFKIASLEDLFTRKAGIKKDEIYSYLLSLNNEHSERLLEIKNILNLTMKELMNKKKESIRLMEMTSKVIKKDYESFKDHIRLKYIKKRGFFKGL